MPQQRELIDGSTGQHFSSLELLVGQAISGGGGGSVTSVFGRTGVVTAQPGDYAASQVTNDSGVAGSGVSGALDTLDSGLTALSGSLASLAAQVAALDSTDIANASGVGGTTVTDALNTLAKASAPVTSVFARTGAVVASKGDYAASQVTNDSGVGGTGVSGALDTLDAAISALVTGVSSVFARTGAVVAAKGDYAASQVTNDSGVGGTGVSGALDTLAANIAALVTGVSSVFGRTGAVTAKSGDYAASEVTNDSGVSGTGVSGALDTLDARITALNPVLMGWSCTAAPATTNPRFVQPSLVFSAIQSTEILTQAAVPAACTFSALAFVCVNTALTTDSVTATLRKNGVDTALTLTIPAGTAPGTVITATADVSFAAGDLVSLKLVEAGATAQTSWNARFTASAK